VQLHCFSLPAAGMAEQSSFQQRMGLFSAWQVAPASLWRKETMGIAEYHCKLITA
jgi:hypothetical protein